MTAPTEVERPPQQWEPPVAAPSRRIESLEDLYAAFPNLRDGSYRIRVERTMPRLVAGMHVAGVICEQDQPISMAELQNFGGHKYTISVLGPTRNRMDEDGSPVLRTLGMVQVTIPGVPLAVPLPPSEDPSVMMRMPSAVEPVQVTTKRMDMEARREEEARKDRGGSIATVRDVATEHVMSLRRDIEAQREDLRKREDEVKRLRDELVDERRKAVEIERETERKVGDHFRQVSERETKALREGFERERALLQEGHQKEVLRWQEQTRGDAEKQRIQISEMSQRQMEQLNAESRRHQEEMTRLNTEMLRRDQDEKERSRERLDALNQQHLRELTTLRENHIQALENVRQSEGSKAVFEKTTANVKQTVLEERCARAEAELAEVRREADRLRKEAYKDTKTYLEEIREGATNFLGMVPAGENAPGAEEGPFDWKKTAAKGFMDLVSKAPEIAKSMMEPVVATREQNRLMAQAQQEQAQAQQQAQARKGRRPVALPPAWPTAQNPPGLPPASGSAGVPSPIYGPPVVMPMMAPPPMPSAPIGSPVPSSTPHMETPVVQSAAAAPSILPPQPQPQAALESQALPEPQATAAPVSMPPTSAINEQQAFEFVNQLEGAIQGEVVPPVLFAQEFVKTVGEATARNLLHQMPSETFLTWLESIPQAKNAAMLTRDGKAYVRAVWAEATKLVGMP